MIAAGFDPDQPTAWALEGLLPYLPGPAQDALFEKVHELSAVGSQIAAELGPAPGIPAGAGVPWRRMSRGSTSSGTCSYVPTP